jgi:hypothetical protein
MQHPRLHLGLLGFSAAQRAQVQNFLALRASQQAGKRPSKNSNASTQVFWEVADYREANALLLCTTQASIDAQQIVRFPPEQDHLDVVGVSPSELKIPYALVGDVNKDIQAVVAANAPQVELGDAASLQIALEYFEASLRSVRTLFALAQHLLERRNDLDESHAFHIVRRGVLDAIVDVPQQRVLVRNGLRTLDLEEADWVSRPASANSAPAGFAIWSMEELAWLYALHNTEMDLPERYLKLPIYLRRPPQVRPALIYPRHVELLELLGHTPCVYQRLLDVFPQRPDLLQRDLYVLFACRAITTSPQRAGLAAIAPATSQPPTTGAFLQSSQQLATQQPFQLETMHAGLH